MFLKSVEIFGFKSFADRSKIEFTEGISALLGPNGCGKSNIVDSIKWVIGELTEPCDVHFGGPNSFMEYPPDRLIVHRLRTYEPDGLKFECPCGKKLISCVEQTDYTEIIYEKRR